MTKRAATRNQKKEDQIVSEEPTEVECKEVPTICGLVMPISEIDGCDTQHWKDVLHIIKESLASIDIDVRLVSASNESVIIQSQIVENLYDDPIVVCDVSCKNPNVMFELGLRLAFDLPTVVIKDDQTDYSFDTSPILHLKYPRDLNYCDIQKFKKTLAATVKSTLEKKDDPEFTTFLKAFNRKKIAKIETEEVPPYEYYSSELHELKNMVTQLVNSRFPFDPDHLSELKNDKVKEITLNRMICKIISDLIEDKKLYSKNTSEACSIVLSELLDTFIVDLNTFSADYLRNKISFWLSSFDV